MLQPCLEGLYENQSLAEQKRLILLLQRVRSVWGNVVKVSSRYLILRRRKEVWQTVWMSLDLKGEKRSTSLGLEKGEVPLSLGLGLRMGLWRESFH